jgi:CSLREA domain-containing protein
MCTTAPRPNHRKTTCPAPHRPAARPRLEGLEDRAVPSTFMVNTALDEVTASDGKLSLREAITAANAHAGADTVILPAGVFRITLPGANEDGNATGDFDTTDSVTIRGAGAGLTVIDGQQQDRVFDVIGTAPSPIKVVFQGLTIRNGDVTGSGGGVRVADADLVVRDCVVSGNRASVAGGGVSDGGLTGVGTVTVVGTTVARNAAGGIGGGIAVFGDGSVLAVSGSTVRRNVSGNVGGGIAAATAAVTGSTVSGNFTSASGGGIDAITAAVTGSTVSGNSAAFFGGGINATSVEVTGSAVSNNFASAAGGGVFASTAAVTGSTVSGNSAGGVGGGGIAAGTATVTNSTVSGNSATAASGSGGASTPGRRPWSTARSRRTWPTPAAASSTTWAARSASRTRSSP